MSGQLEIDSEASEPAEGHKQYTGILCTPEGKNRKSQYFAKALEHSNRFSIHTFEQKSKTPKNRKNTTSGFKQFFGFFPRAVNELAKIPYLLLLKKSPDGRLTKLAYCVLRLVNTRRRDHPISQFCRGRISTAQTDLDVVDFVILYEPEETLINDLAVAQLASGSVPLVAIIGDIDGRLVDRLQRTNPKVHSFSADVPPEEFCASLNILLTSDTEVNSQTDCVLVIADDFLLDEPAGNATVLERQLSYLTSRGENILLAIVTPSPNATRSSHFNEVLNRYSICATIEVNLHALGDRRSYGDLDVQTMRSFGRPVDQYRHIKFHPDLASILHVDRVKYAIVNYCWALQLLEGFPRVFPVICETHDIQSRQWAVQSGKDVHPGDLKVELGLLSSADALIAISETESEFLSKSLRPDRIHYNVGGFDMPDTEMLQQRYLNIRQACAVAGTEFPIETGPKEEPFDLLFVGHSNIHNVNALRWLIEEVIPLIEPHINLVVVGAISNRPEVIGYKKTANIHIVGKAEDLTPLYFATKVVAVPLLSGEGTSIKTVEAMAHGKAIAATPKGLRGLGDLDYPRSDDAKGYADLLERLLLDENYRANIEQKSIEVAAFFRKDAYFDRFDTVVQRAKETYSQN